VTSAPSPAPAALTERVGLVVRGPDAAAAVAGIVAAEAAGVRQVWMTQGATAADTLVTFAAAAMRTSTVRADLSAPSAGAGAAGAGRRRPGARSPAARHRR